MSDKPHITIEVWIDDEGQPKDADRKAAIAGLVHRHVERIGAVTRAKAYTDRGELVAGTPT